jgi:hypothetical protein
MRRAIDGARHGWGEGMRRHDRVPGVWTQGSSYI